MDESHFPNLHSSLPKDLKLDGGIGDLLFLEAPGGLRLCEAHPLIQKASRTASRPPSRARAASRASPSFVPCRL